jgi:hypothetical protein
VFSWAAGRSADASSAVLCWTAAAGCGAAAAAAGPPAQLLVWKPGDRDRAVGKRPHHPLCAAAAAAARRDNATGCSIVLEMFCGADGCVSLPMPGNDAV